MEKFAYKTEVELQKMTSEERDGYATSKRKFEQNQSEEAITKAIEEFKSKMVAEQKEKESAVKTEIDELKETVKTQGTKIIEMNKNVSENVAMETADKAFEKVYKDAKGENEELQKDEPLKIQMKDIASTSVMSVATANSTAFPAAGSNGVVTSGMYSLWARFLGFFGLMSPESRVMDLVDVQRLSEGRLYVVNTTVVGDAAVTPECTLKPIVRMTFTDQSVDADPVAAMWFTTTKLRRFYTNIVDLFRNTFAELVNKKIPQTVLTAIRANATAFTPNPLFNIDANPNNYDALGAVIASIQNLGYLPNGILINPIAYRNMKQSKNNQGTYNLSNGNSISIVDGGLDWNGTAIPIILDPTLQQDEFIVGDLFTAVKVGLDNELIYMETDGRVDSNSTGSVSGLAKNIRTHVLERFVAAIVPNGTKALIIRDTFSNVKTLITLVEGGE